LDVEGVEQLLLDPVWGLAEQVVEQGQPVQQGRVAAGGLGGLFGQGGELGVDVVAFGFEFGEPFEVAGAQGGDGGGVGV